MQGTSNYHREADQDTDEEQVAQGQAGNLRELADAIKWWKENPSDRGELVERHAEVEARAKAEAWEVQMKRLKIIKRKYCPTPPSREVSQMSREPGVELTFGP